MFILQTCRQYYIFVFPLFPSLFSFHFNCHAIQLHCSVQKEKNTHSQCVPDAYYIFFLSFSFLFLFLFNSVLAVFVLFCFRYYIVADISSIFLGLLNLLTVLRFVFCFFFLSFCSVVHCTYWVIVIVRCRYTAHHRKLLPWRSIIIVIFLFSFFSPCSFITFGLFCLFVVFVLLFFN